MNKDDLIEKLIIDMSLTLMAMGQIICNSMRDEKNIVRIQEVAICWLNMCPLMSRAEWLLGTRALVHYCESMGYEAAYEAIEILDDPEDLYTEYSRMLRGAEQIRGKNRNAGTFEWSLSQVRTNYLGCEQQIED